MDLTHYRGYLVTLRRDGHFWQFIAAPSTPDLSILSRRISDRFSARNEALEEAKRQIDRLLRA
jgi:lipocalin